MGLTVEQWHTKRTKEIADYVLENGNQLTKTKFLWNTYPICVKDVCVTDILVTIKGKDKKDLEFGYMRNGKFLSSRTPNDLERYHLEEIIVDMKEADSKKKYKKI